MNPLITKYLTFLLLLTIHKYYVSSTLIDYSTNTETHQLSLKIFHDDLEKDLGFDTNELDYSEYVFTADPLASYKYYRVKIVLTSTSQVYVPRMKDLRVMALA